MLAARGAAPERFVALALPRGIELVVAMLAVAKTGAAFVPIDPAYPVDRIGFLLADSAPRSSSVTGDGGVLPATTVPVTLLEETGDDAAATGALPAAVLSNAAYLIYTSGSTGLPGCGRLAPRPGQPGRRADRAVRRTAGEPGAAVRLDELRRRGLRAVHGSAERCLPGARARRPAPSRATLADLLTEQRITHATIPPAALAVLAADDLPAGMTLVVAGRRRRVTWSSGSVPVAG
ncbi:AMP-binding protein [Micromonospora sp. M12]